MSADVMTVTEPVAPEPSVGRAGRNLPAAIAVGLAMGGTVLVTLYTDTRIFLAVLVLAILFGLRELTRALATGGYSVPYIPLAAGTAAVIVTSFVYGRDALVLTALITAVGATVWRTAEGRPERVLSDLAASMFALIYVGVMAGFASLMLANNNGADRITCFVSTVVACDVGGYTAGVLRGRHPLAPTVSPKKSWEGLAGSLIFCAAIGGLLVVELLNQPWWKGIVFGLVIAVAAVVGDLGESMVKRDLGIKDMGHLLPGHGGLMDRLDSLLPSAPVAWGLLAIFVGTH